MKQLPLLPGATPLAAAAQRAKCAFSRMRSCAMATQSAGGDTARARASSARAWAGTFSNSVVTAWARAASSRKALGSR